MFVHVVLYWLKKDADADAVESRRKLEADIEGMLKKIPTLRHVWFGRPVPSPRDVVDGSYDVGLCTIFDDKAGHDTYQVHPLHKEFLERNKPNWERIRVYDFAE